MTIDRTVLQVLTSALAFTPEITPKYLDDLIRVSDSPVFLRIYDALISGHRSLEPLRLEQFVLLPRLQIETLRKVAPGRLIGAVEAYDALCANEIDWPRSPAKHLIDMLVFSLAEQLPGYKGPVTSFQPITIEPCSSSGS